MDKQHYQKVILAEAVSAVLKSWGLPDKDNTRNWYIAGSLLSELEEIEAFKYLGRT
jgi:hypothetical protein